MKKILIPLSVGMLLFASCKKDYTCDCTTTTTTTTDGNVNVGVSSSKTTFKDVTKKAVTEELDCYSSGHKYSYENFGGNLVTVDYQTECKLIK